MGGSWWVEIVLLAMLAGFIALRLVSVLGRRTGHERPVGDLYRAGTPEAAPAGAAMVDARARPSVTMPDNAEPAVRDGIQAIAAADPGFDPVRFVEGAKGAYRMILEAFWKGDLAEVEAFVADDAADQFRRSVAARATDGLTVDNRLVDIDDARLVGASLDGMMAEVTVRFAARIVSTARDAQGGVVGGAAPDTEVTHDERTFRRHVATGDPNWLLVATETAED